MANDRIELTKYQAKALANDIMRGDEDPETKISEAITKSMKLLGTIQQNPESGMPGRVNAVSVTFWIVGK